MSKIDSILDDLALALSEDIRDRIVKQLRLDENAHTRDGCNGTTQENPISDIIKSVVGVLYKDRIKIFETKSYVAVMLDNKRMTICRIHYNGTRKILKIYNGHKDEQGRKQFDEHDVKDVDIIREYKDEILKACYAYEGKR